VAYEYTNLHTVTFTSEKELTIEERETVAWDIISHEVSDTLNELPDGIELVRTYDVPEEYIA